MVIMDYRPAEQRDREAIDRILALSFSRIYAHYARKSLVSLADTLVAVEGDGWWGSPTGASSMSVKGRSATYSGWPYTRIIAGWEWAKDSS